MTALTNDDFLYCSCTCGQTGIYRKPLSGEAVYWCPAHTMAGKDKKMKVRPVKPGDTAALDQRPAFGLVVQ